MYLTGFRDEVLIFGKRNLQEKNSHKPALLQQTASPRLFNLKYAKLGNNLGPQRPILPQSKFVKGPFSQSPQTHCYMTGAQENKQYVLNLKQNLESFYNA